MAAEGLSTFLFQAMREEISPGIRDTLPKIDPFFDMVWNQWEGVEKGHIGRPAYNASSANPYAATWVYRWLWAATGGGSFRFTNPSPNLIATAGKNVGVLAQTTGFPGATDYVAPKWHNPFIGLIQGRGVIALPWQLLRTNQLDSVLTDLVAENVKASAQLTAQSEAVCWFSRNPSWGEVLRTPVDQPLTGVDHRAVSRARLNGTAFPTANAGLTFKKDATSGVEAVAPEDSISRLRPGMSVDVWEVMHDDSAEDLIVLNMESNAGIGFVVDQVDFINQAFTVVTKDGAAAQAMTVAGEDADWFTYIVTLHKSVTLATNAAAGDLTALATENDRQDAVDAGVTDTLAYGSDGLLSFIKSAYSDTLYGVKMEDVPNLMSSEVANHGDYLTEKHFNNWIGEFLTQYGPDKLFDTLLTTNGVLNGFVENLTGVGPSSGVEFIRFNMDRTGKPVRFESGWDDIGIRYRNRVFKVLDSPMVAKQNLFGIKTRDKNLKRLMPPPIPGASGQPKFRDVDFVAPLGGAKGIYMFGRDANGALADQLEAPYVVEYQHFITDPQSLRVRGITEATGR